MGPDAAASRKPVPTRQPIVAGTLALALAVAIVAPWGMSLPLAGITVLFLLSLDFLC